MLEALRSGRNLLCARHIEVCVTARRVAVAGGKATGKTAGKLALHRTLGNLNVLKTAGCLRHGIRSSIVVPGQVMWLRETEVCHVTRYTSSPLKRP
jgi:hypothetical protein